MCNEQLWPDFLLYLVHSVSESSQQLLDNCNGKGQLLKYIINIMFSMDAELGEEGFQSQKN